MTNASETTAHKDQALALLKQWDAQQTGYIRYRQMRFEAMCSVIRHVCPDGNPRILDLACGPGSLIQLLLASFPEGQIVGVDKDPLLLNIASDIFQGNDRVTLQECDLDTPHWLDGLEGQYDAIVSTTALHWLEPELLTRVYYELADLVRPGGVFMNGDHLKYDALTQPVLREIAEKDDVEAQHASLQQGADSWDEWWITAESVQRYANSTERRKTVWANKNNATPKVTVGFHLEALRSAGFAQTGTVWQYLDDFVVAAFR